MISEGGWSDARKRPWCKEGKQVLDPGKGRETDLSLGPPGGIPPCLNLEFRTSDL